MELSETLRTRDCELNLQWVPRDLNQLADDLTNQKFDSFPLDKRIQFVGGDTKWLVLDRLMHKAQEFHEELAREKKQRVQIRNRNQREPIRKERWSRGDPSFAKGLRCCSEETPRKIKVVKQTSKRKVLGTPTVFNKSGDEKERISICVRRSL